MKGVTFAHPTIMARANVYNKLNGYNEDKSVIGAEDYELWFRFFKNVFKGYNLQEGLYCLRENKVAYKRKNVSRRVSSIKVINWGRKYVGIRGIYKLYIIKSLVALAIPNSILRGYHRLKFSKRSSNKECNRQYISRRPYKKN